MKTKQLLIVWIGILLFSCSDNAKTANNTQENLDVNSVVGNSKNLDPEAKGGNKCLLGYGSKLDELLTLDEVVSLTGFSKDIAEVDVEQTSKNPLFNYARYKFSNKRTEKIGSYNILTEVSDFVSVRNLDEMSMKQFDFEYKAITQEELDDLNQVTDDLIDGKIENSDVEDAVKQAENAGVNKENMKKTSGAITGLFKEVSEGYRNVEGLGDAARWNVVTNELVVISNGVKFDVQVEISKDTEKNKELAIKFAQLILKKCS